MFVCVRVCVHSSVKTPLVNLAFIQSLPYLCIVVIVNEQEMLVFVCLFVLFFGSVHI